MVTEDTLIAQRDTAWAKIARLQEELRKWRATADANQQRVIVLALEQERDAATAELREAQWRINRMQVALSDIEQYVRLGDDEGIWGATSRALGWLVPGDLAPIDPLPTDRTEGSDGP